MHSPIIKIIHSDSDNSAALTTLISIDDDRSKAVAVKLGGLEIIKNPAVALNQFFFQAWCVQSMYPLCFRGDNLFSG